MARMGFSSSSKALLQRRRRLCPAQAEQSRSRLFIRYSGLKLNHKTRATPPHFIEPSQFGGGD
jgi:hypothetical protein